LMTFPVRGSVLERMWYQFVRRVKSKHTLRADFVLNSHEALLMCAGIIFSSNEKSRGLSHGTCMSVSCYSIYIFSLDERSDLLLRRHGQVPVIFGSGAIALGASWDTRLDTQNNDSGILVNWSQDVC
jgi:hypothetical protein